MEYEWRVDGSPTVFEVGGQRFDIDKRGVEYAAQFGRLTAWLGTNGVGALMAAYDAGVISDEDVDGNVSIDVLSRVMEYGLTPEAVIDLGAIILGCDYEFAEEHFDPGWLGDGVLTLLDVKPGISAAFARVWERFFLAGEQPAGVEED